MSALTALSSYPFLRCSPGKLRSEPPPWSSPVPYPSPSDDGSDAAAADESREAWEDDLGGEVDVSPLPTGELEGLSLEERSEALVARICHEEGDAACEEEGEEWETLPCKDGGVEGEEGEEENDESYIDEEYAADPVQRKARNHLLRSTASVPTSSPPPDGRRLLSTQATSVSLPISFAPSSDSHDFGRRAYIDQKRLQVAEGLVGGADTAGDPLGWDDDIEDASPPLSRLLKPKKRPPPPHRRPHQNPDSHRFKPLPFSSAARPPSSAPPSSGSAGKAAAVPATKRRKVSQGESSRGRATGERKEREEREEKGSGGFPEQSGRRPSASTAAPAQESGGAERRRRGRSFPVPLQRPPRRAPPEAKQRRLARSTAYQPPAPPPPVDEWYSDEDDDEDFVRLVRRDPQQARQQLSARRQRTRP